MSKTIFLIKIDIIELTDYMLKVNLNEKYIEKYVLS